MKKVERYFYPAVFTYEQGPVSYTHLGKPDAAVPGRCPREGVFGHAVFLGYLQIPLPENLHEFLVGEFPAQLVALVLDHGPEFGMHLLGQG